MSTTESDTVYTWSDSTTASAMNSSSSDSDDDGDKKRSKSSTQIFAAVAMCYFCICGGNLLGYTSSAIPSMKGSGLIESQLTTTTESIESPSPNLNFSFSFNTHPLSLLGGPEQEQIQGEADLFTSNLTPNKDSSNNNNNNDHRQWKWIESRLHFGSNDDEEFRKLTNTQASWVSGLTPLGAFFGSFTASIPLFYLGPKGTSLYLCTPIFLIGWLAIAFAPVLEMVYLGRFLGGLAMGISTSVSPVYIMETASIQLRGPLGTLSQLFITVGIFTSFVLGSFLDWREMALVLLCLVVPGIFLLLLIPESPCWLLRKGRLAEARSAHCRLHGDSITAEIEFSQLKLENYSKDNNSDPNNVVDDYNGYNSDRHTIPLPVLIATIDMDLNQNERNEKSQSQKNQLIEDEQITMTLRSEGKGQLDKIKRKEKRENKTDSPSIIKITKDFLDFIGFEFSRPGVLKSTLVVFALMIIQQVIGINAVNFYTVTIFELALGPDAWINGHLSSVIVALMLCFATLGSVFLIEKLGRKLLLVLSCIFVGLGSFSIGLFFYFIDTGGNVSSLAWLPLVSLVVFVVAFSLGQGPVLWIIGAEILEPSIRAIVNPLAVGLNWFCVFAVAKTYPDLVNLMGTFATFWLYSALALCGTIFTLIYVPETRRKNAEQIRQFFIR